MNESNRRRPAAVWLGAFVLLTAPGFPALADVVLETGQFRLIIAENGTLKSLTRKPDGVEYAVVDPPCPVAVVCRGGQMVPSGQGEFAAVTGRWLYRGGQQFRATRVRQQGDRLTIEFDAARTRAVYRVRSTDRYLAFELLAVEREPVDRIVFLRLNIRRLPMLGQWVNVAYDEQFGICLCSGNVRTDSEMWPQERHVLMKAAAEAGVGFPGATAVLFGCREPKDHFLDTMAAIEKDFHLPSGATFRRSPLQKMSYFWASRPNPQNIEQYIRWARLGGFRILLLSYSSFSRAPGHFQWNDQYPNGMADLKRVTDAIRQAGLKLGLHIHYSKAGKKDLYVTPVPDDRLHILRTFSLASTVSSESTVLPIREDPAGSTLDQGRRLLKLGKELIEYQEYNKEAPFQFTGCRRGDLGSSAASHPAGAKVDLLDVDSWPLFIRLDQNTDIQDEVARRIAAIYRQTGPYEMVYFDGAEDVHEPFWYHVAAAQYRVFRLLEPPPPVCESAHYTHFSWHMISRSNAYDVVASPDGMKDFCRLMPCPTAGARALDFSRIQFGWLGRLGRSKQGYAGPDVIEYIASRAAAWDCPIAVHATVEELRSSPRAEDCLAVIKIWEDARIGNHLSEADRKLLRNVAPEDAHYVSCYQQRGIYQNCRDNRDLTLAQRRILADRREHHLFLDENGRYELVPIKEVPGVAQGAVMAYLFRRMAKPDDVYVLAWAVDGRLRLRLPVARLTAMRPFGTPHPCESVGDSSEVQVGPRTYLVFQRTDNDTARQRLRQAQVVP